MKISDWLEKQYYGFLTSKKNDVDLAKILRAIRSKARTKGYTEEQMNQAIKTAKEYKAYIDEQNKLHTQVKPKPPEKEPATPEPTQVIQDTRTEAELSRRAKFSGEPVKQRNDKDSMILRMADEKK